MEAKFNPAQLKTARLARGFTMTELAKLSSLSRESISKYELGATTPRGDSILKLAHALNFPVNYFGKSNQTIHMGTVFFRSQAASTNKYREMQKARLTFTAQSLAYISTYINLPELNIPIPLDMKITDITPEIIKHEASKVRELWNLGNGPIRNLTNIMETNGIIIAETTMQNDKLDAVSTWAGNRPIIALTDNDESTMRRRFNLAHELGHVLLHAGVENIFDLNNKIYKNILEKQANEFASNLLLPEESFTDYLVSTSMPFFRKAKLFWNVSIGALIYRAHSLNLLSENQFTYLERQISWNHWRKQEPDDNRLPQEHPQIFQKALQMLIEADIVTKQDIATELGLPVEELETTFRTAFKNINQSAEIVPHLKIVR